MATVTVRDPSGAEKGKMDLPPELFEAKISRHVMWQVVTNYLNNQRQGTSQVKTRGMVSGGGRKPWRQKGTGRARSGTNRSNIWVGGARAFGPTPKDYHVQLPKKVRRMALRSALTVKAQNGHLTVLSGLGVTEGKTREIYRLVQSLGLGGQRCLIVVPGNDSLVLRAVRNLPRVTTASAAEVHTYEILRADHVLITGEAIEALKEARAK